jgi:hypothetical protein
VIPEGLCTGVVMLLLKFMSALKHLRLNSCLQACNCESNQGALVVTATLAGRRSG